MRLRDNVLAIAIANATVPSSHTYHSYHCHRQFHNKNYRKYHTTDAPQAERKDPKGSREASRRVSSARGLVISATTPWISSRKFSAPVAHREQLFPSPLAQTSCLEYPEISSLGKKKRCEFSLASRSASLGGRAGLRGSLERDPGEFVRICNIFVRICNIF